MNRISKNTLLWTGMLVGASLCSSTVSAYDYFRNTQLPGVRRPDVSLDKVVDEAGEGGVPVSYQRRTVEWWPKKGVDIVDVPEGAVLRTWTINPKTDPKEIGYSADAKWWPLYLRDKKQFKAHLIGFRGIGMGIGNPWKKANNPYDKDYYMPGVVLRLEDGRKRCFTADYFIEEDERFVVDLYEKEMKRLRDNTFEQGIEWAVSPRDKMDFPPGELYQSGTALIESKHFVATLGAEDPRDTQGSMWLMDKDKQQAAANREMIMRGWEDWWAYLEYAGHLMPYWEKPEHTKYKYAIQIGGTRKNGTEILGRGNGGGYGGMTTANGNWWAIYHEWTHGQLCGGMISLGGGETMCDSAQVVGDPSIAGKMMFQVVKPWKNLFWGAYPGGYTWVNMGDDPNWGYCAVSTIPPMMTEGEHTPMHAIARLGKERGIFKNGVRGMGDFLGEIGARMAEFDTELQASLRASFTMPTRVSLRPLDLEKRVYRSPDAYAPEPFGVNIVRLVPDKDTAQITVDFQGHYNPDTFSDWRACIVAVDSEGRCRYSALWNKGKMSIPTKSGDLRYWLTVTATPYALSPSHQTGAFTAYSVYQGAFAFRYPYDVQLTGCRPGSPHTTLEEDDVLNHTGGVWGMRNGEGACSANIPTPSDTAGYEKMRSALQGTQNSVAVKHLQNSVGHRHPNGGGWVAESATVADTAYVAAGAMVLDGAKVLDKAVINDYVIVTGPNVLIKDNARIYGKLVISGPREYSGAARVYRRDESQESVAYDIPQQREDRFKDLGYRLQANYECDISETVTIEDTYKEHSTDVFFYGAHRNDQIVFDGVLKGSPGFEKNGEGGCYTFNGKNQYAELPGEVADLEEITLNLGFRHSGTVNQTLYEFGTSEKDFFRLSISNGKLEVTTAKDGQIASIAASGTVTADAWTACRVEMNGSDIAIYVNDVKAASKASTFRASDAFVPGLPPLGSLGAGRKGSNPIKGAIDYFRIYTTVYDNFADAPVPLVATRKIADNYLDRFNKAFPNHEDMKAQAENSAASHPLTLYYRKYNAAVQTRLKALRSVPSAKVTALEEKLGSLRGELTTLQSQVNEAMRSDQAFQAKQREAEVLRKKEVGKLQALCDKNADYAAAKTLLDSPVAAESQAAKKRAETTMREVRRAVEKSGEGSAILARINDLHEDYIPAPALASKMLEITQQITKQEVLLEKEKVAVAAAANPAEYAALNATLYFGNAYERFVKKALVNALPPISDDIEQVRMALQYQNQKWHTDADWDGRASYEHNPDAVKQPVMQMWLKKMKPWMYK